MTVFKKFQGKRITSKHPEYANARWYCWRRIGKGRIIHKALPEAQTKQQAETAERLEVEKVFNRKYGIVEDVSFSDFTNKTYRKYVKQHNENVYVKDLFIKELNKFFGKKFLSQITAQDCRDYQFRRKNAKTKHGAKRSPSSVNKETSTLSKIFTLACQEGLLERNPMQYVVKLTEPPARKRLLSEAQKESLWKELEKDEYLYNLVTLALNLPMRRGQLLAITKESVDFDLGILKAIKSKGREPRNIPLNGKAAEVLKYLCSKVEKGDLFLIKDFRKRWHKALIDAGINKEDGTREENYHFHDIRSWLSQRLLKRNTNSKVIQNLFAHSDESITDIYLTADEMMMADALRSLDDPTIQTEGLN